MTMRSMAYRQAAVVLPPALREKALSLPLCWQEAGEEFRLRAGRPMTLLAAGRERETGGQISQDDLRGVLEIATRASAHTALERVRQGFVTLPGGHRLGLCGTAVIEEGKVRTFRALSSLNLRVAREIRGAAAEAIPALLADGPVNTLILGPPGAGKTTFLRDFLRALSDEAGLRVGVADERGEIAALWEGLPTFDLGAHTDIIDGCPKALGLELLLRGMNPQVLAMDEITSPADVNAAVEAAGCGVVVVATAHGKSVQDLFLRPVYHQLPDVFQKVAVLSQNGDGLREFRIEPIPAARRERGDCQ